MFISDYSMQRMNKIDFSIIIPTFNTEKHIEDCLNSVYANTRKGVQFEVLVIDDCSTDSTRELAINYQKDHENLILLKTETKAGPGVARNVGVKNASGDWILFLDSDDYYDENALLKLKEFIDAHEGDTLDAVGFNWLYSPSSISVPKTHFEGRMDSHYLELEKDQLIRSYLKLRMDNSVIYTSVRRKLLLDNDIWFHQGYHEDVVYIFLVYWYARKVKYLDQVLYYKTSRPDSIVNTISKGHIKGFMRAYNNIGIFIDTEKNSGGPDYHHDYYTGLIGLIATRAREIYRNCTDARKRAILYRELYENWLKIDKKPTDDTFPYNNTLYSLVCEYFLNVMRHTGTTDSEKEVLLTKYLNETSVKRWSCKDLHHSVFLRPEEIRTCCKRFFVNEIMRGDVVLLDSSQINTAQPNAEKILTAKKQLYASINRGEKTPCDGCPFLEFKVWGALDHSKIHTLSFEYHSVCNLRCTYCCATYYGGSRAHYDVSDLVQDLLNKRMLSEHVVIIWGGGEPVLDNNFAFTIHSIIDQLPHSKHRVITNAVSFSEAIQTLLSEDKISTFTSVDAGTSETFTKIRGRDKLSEVLENLRKYAAANAKKVTVKYIFTTGNASLEEIKAFVHLVKKYELLGCNLQISFDFKADHIPIDVLVLMVTLYKLLIEVGCRLVFFDELLRQRLSSFDRATEESFKLKARQAGIHDILADKDLYQSVAIWGAGEQAKLLIEKSIFFKHVHVEYFVDSTPGKIGTKYYNRKILSPEVLMESDIPVVIAAVQNYAPIYQQFLKLGIDKSRLISKLIL
jgi:glycosyltransferase involved in cell wall biosynthesis/pyruvate-formate lyase-activating enzyme